MKFHSLNYLISAIKKLWKNKIRTGSLRHRMAIMLISLFILFGGIFGYKFLRILLMSHPTPLPVSVSTTIVKVQEWQTKIKSVGTLRAIQGVDVTTELAGMIRKIHFTPGSKINESDILVELNAEAEIAQRDSLKALVELAEITYKRDKSQFAAGAISQVTLDFDKADLKNKKAQLAQQEAIIAKKRIHAPFAGILGISKINLGQYLNAGDKIITLQSLDPIYVDFSLPQQSLNILKVGQKVALKVDTYENELFIGTITSIDPKIDVSTRNVQLEATFSNQDLKLYPGMFGEVNVYTGTINKALTLPKLAISFNPFGEIVYLVKEKGKDKAGKPILTVQQSFITVGESREDETVVLKGVKEGDQVVTAGQLKLKNGTNVRINNSIDPRSTLASPQTDD
jgi:membrane fusion protein (multidrug efflux system)